MPVEIIEGNIFTSRCQVLVNTINCVGVMGAGIALECRLRYPEMYLKYVRLCDEKKIDIGKLWIYKDPARWILNFPTKMHWKFPSKLEYLHSGLDKFCKTYKEREIESIAFPLLGADKGGIPQHVSLEIICLYLDKLDIQVEVYRYDPVAKDDLYDKVKEWILSNDIENIARASNLRKDYVRKVIDAIKSPNIYQLNQLARVQGIGIKTLEKIFDLATNEDDGGEKGQLSLL